MDEEMKDQSIDGIPKRTYGEIEELLRIVTKIASRDVKHRRDIAFIKRDLKYILDPVEEARDIPPEMKQYNEEHIAILRKHGTPMGAGGYSVAQAKLPEVQAQIAVLNEKYADALKAEQVRVRQIEEMMQEEIEFDVMPLKEEWLGDNIDSNDFERLLDLDFLDLKSDGDAGQQDEVRKARNRRKARKRK
ncbi:MAG: hypothetical protein PHI12_14805 [Dehalococcoidales bacterium]|nr:hypothetical protein [Dehalococcoidales bacterium]